MGGFGAERFPHIIHNGGDICDIDTLPVSVQDLNETAHVCPLEVVRQVYIHVDGRNGMLGAIFLVQHRDGITDALHPHLVDFDVAVVFEALDVGDFTLTDILRHGFQFFSLRIAPKRVQGLEDSRVQVKIY
jgi:hypothetical protein